MKLLDSPCIDKIDHSLVVVEENGRKAVFVNRSRQKFLRIKIDDCLVRSGRRCDYLVVKKEVASVLIELKGKDIEHACDQLFASADHSAVKGLVDGPLGFLIVASRYPRFDTYVMRAKTIAARKYRAGLRIVNNIGEFAIEDLVSIGE
jgi:hypothetical protein